MVTVDPTFVPPPPPVLVTSPDGVLTAEVDAANAGVLLTANYATTPEIAQRVRFHRSDGSLVRSGDPAWAPGGWANAYDHESPLGVGASWYAVPVDSSGVEGPASSLVAVEIPAPAHGSGNRGAVWVKSVTDPGLSMRLDFVGFPEQSRAGRVSAQRVAGSAFPATSWDRRSAVATSLAMLTDTLADKNRLEALLDSGPLLCQLPAVVGIGDFFFLPGDVSYTYSGGTELDPQRIWSVSATEIARPATLESPLYIPGRTYDALPGSYTTYNDLAVQVPSYNALLGADTLTVTNEVTNPRLRDLDENGEPDGWNSDPLRFDANPDPAGGCEFTALADETAFGGAEFKHIMPMGEGEPVTMGIVLSPGSVGTAADFWLLALAYGASGFIATIDTEPARPPDDGPERVVSATTPAGTTHVHLAVYHASGTMLAGDTIRLDFARQEPALEFSSSYGDGDSEGWVWDGTPHASTSHTVIRVT